MKIQIKTCKSNWDKFRGLMFSKKRNLLFVFDKERKISLHSFFVFFSFDAFFLDRNKKIIEIKKNFRPFRIYNSKKKAKYVLELTKGSQKLFKHKKYV